MVCVPDYKSRSAFSSLRLFFCKFISGKREDSIRAGGDPESTHRSGVQQTPGENGET